MSTTTTVATAPTATPPQAFDVLSLAPFAVMVVLFYFLTIRPQQKKQKTVQDMLGGMKKGDRVLTQGGILGVITGFHGEHEVEVEIATGVTIKMMKTGIVDVLAKPQPVKGNVTKLKTKKDQ